MFSVRRLGWAIIFNGDGAMGDVEGICNRQPLKKQCLVNMWPQNGILRISATPSLVFEIEELLDMIIDYLHDDSCTLTRVAAVCRAWARSSQYHLYSSIFLSPSSIGLIRTLAKPHFSGMVYSLNIYLSTTAPVSAYLEILRVKFPRLQFSLRAIRPKSVAFLPYSEYRFTGDFVLEALSATPHLGVETRRVLKALLASDDTGCQGVGFDVDQLVIPGMPGCITTHLLRGQCRSWLGSLQTASLTLIDPASLSAILDASRDSISTLELISVKSLDPMPRDFKLPNLPRLLNLVVHGFDGHGLSSFYDFLCELSIASRLKTVILKCGRISTPHHQSLAQYYWQRLDSLLSESFPFADVQIEVPQSSGSSKAHEIRDRFPTLTDCGRLSVAMVV
ncbi:hypothetical protein C8R43DRAFT_1207603 [Mycena crocata]|nr:hypothetical protein C8R43DRAFT_1207603 [Mycena crocata]